AALLSMRGFGSFNAAARFCTAHDELRDYFRPRPTTGMAVSLAEQRQVFRDRWDALIRLIAA
ncbi:MAG TPA: IS6 family transposase, partial [Dehalococcoidia bacterium]|nr:IS6 family transposase [Dehalococcoidia bacterium]